ncbi:hypothetical protein WJX73_004424 [Symbiochloris irregularis]|uniref:Uncharacterized protein n=1 Tax=Symbiochloris irregularis TaxID=706552 RepID=A0AAW1NNG0_9CHLO
MRATNLSQLLVLVLGILATAGQTSADDPAASDLHQTVHHFHEHASLHSSLPYDFSDTFSNAQHYILTGKCNQTNHTVNLHVWLKAAALPDTIWVRGFFVADDLDQLNIQANAVLNPPQGFFDGKPHLYLRDALKDTQHNFALRGGPHKPGLMLSMFDMNLTLPLADLDTGFELRYNDWERGSYWVPRHALDRHVRGQDDFTQDMHDAQLIMVFFAPFHETPSDFADILEQSVRYHHEIQGFDQVIQVLLTFYIHFGETFNTQSRFNGTALVPSACAYLGHFRNMVRVLL